MGNLPYSLTNNDIHKVSRFEGNRESVDKRKRSEAWCALFRKSCFWTAFLIMQIFEKYGKIAR